MIRHFVLLRFRREVSREQKQALYDSLEGLRARLTGVLSFQAVENVSVEQELVRGNFDGFWLDFEDEGARNAYLADSEYQRIGAEIADHLEGGVSGVTVFDMSI